MATDEQDQKDDASRGNYASMPDDQLMQFIRNDKSPCYQEAAEEMQRRYQDQLSRFFASRSAGYQVDHDDLVQATWVKFLTGKKVVRVDGPGGLGKILTVIAQNVLADRLEIDGRRQKANTFRRIVERICAWTKLGPRSASDLINAASQDLGQPLGLKLPLNEARNKKEELRDAGAQVEIKPVEHDENTYDLFLFGQLEVGPAPDLQPSDAGKSVAAGAVAAGAEPVDRSARSHAHLNDELVEELFGGRLSSKERDVMLGSMNGEWPRELAAKLGCSDNYVSQIKASARRKLKQQYRIVPRNSKVPPGFMIKILWSKTEMVICREDENSGGRP